MTLEEIFAQAVARHQASELSAAEELYLQVLRIDPRHPDALNLMGVLTRQQGRLEESERFIRDAMAAAPEDIRYPFNLGETLRASGKFQEAVTAYESLLHANEHDARAWHALGMALEKSGREAEALAAFQRAVIEDAQLVPALESLVAILWRTQRLDEAAAASRQLIAIAPADATRLNRHAALLLQTGEIPAAVGAYTQAAQLHPASPEPLIGLANCFYRMGQLVDSAKAARQAALVAPQSARAHISLALALEKLGKNSEAVELLKTAAWLDPNEPLAHGNLGKSLLDRFQLQQAIESGRRAVALAPETAGWHSNLLLILNLTDAIDDRELFEEHRRWAQMHAEKLAPHDAPRPRDPDPNRRLRIGYLSPDFRNHPVLSFFEPILDGHNRSEFEPILYSNAPRADSGTARVREKVGADAWREITDLPDGQVADMFERDRIDILVDLAGHTAGNRLLVMARARVPVQVTYLGYPNTTGISRSVLQYRLTDALCDPPGAADELHSETLVRLPGCFLCYRPNPDAPDVQPPPSQANGFVTFGSFCTMMKITPKVIEVWSKVLGNMPGSRFLLKNRAMDDGEIRQRVGAEFASHGIGSERLTFLGQDASPIDHLAQYHKLDIALDTFPYNGTTTTCEALWMGVPVVTLVGSSHRSRVGLSLLSNVGLERLCAGSVEQFVTISVELAEKRDVLPTMRMQMRQQMQASPLMDEQRFVRNLEAAYRQMWIDCTKLR